MYFRFIRSPLRSRFFAYTTLFRSQLTARTEYMQTLKLRIATQKLILAFIVLCISIIGFYYSLRSEEHTSKLQSRGQLVCRPMLEKTQLNIKIKKMHK